MINRREFLRILGLTPLVIATACTGVENQSIASVLRSIGADPKELEKKSAVFEHSIYIYKSGDSVLAFATSFREFISMGRFNAVEEVEFPLLATKLKVIPDGESNYKGIITSNNGEEIYGQFPIFELIDESTEQEE